LLLCQLQISSVHMLCCGCLVTSAAAQARPLSLQAIITRAPLATIASAVACPTPALPPVIMQTCSIQDACQSTSQLDKTDMPQGQSDMQHLAMKIVGRKSRSWLTYPCKNILDELSRAIDASAKVTSKVFQVLPEPHM